MDRLFSIESTWGEAWLRFKKHWATGILLALGQLVLSVIPGANVVLSFVLPAIFIRYGLRAWDSSEPFSFGEAFPKELSVYGKIIVGQLIILLIPLLILGAGLADQKSLSVTDAILDPLLILLAIGSTLILLVLFFPYPFLVVDKGVDVAEGFRLAYQIAKPNLVRIVSVLLIALLANVVGMLFCFAGLLVTQPLTYIAVAGLYRQLMTSPDKRVPPSYL